MTPVQEFKREMQAILRAHDALRKRAVRAAEKLLRTNGQVVKKRKKG